MRIGIIIGRCGDIDGVSLETEKWITVLKRMGHEVFIISGKFTEHTLNKKKRNLIFHIIIFFTRM